MKKILFFIVFVLIMPRAVSADWPMAGANPARTSWVNETLPDVIKTQWVKPLYSHVPQRVQVIGAENKVYVSTSMGLYAFDAATGADVWTYPTALPLGHSPTYVSEGGIGYLYVGGLDKRIHKIRASNGQGIWISTIADGGYVTSPIIANNKVYATNRDGALYAFNTSDGNQAWKFQTGNQIYQSPAMADNVLYIASNDGYAYAVNALTGTQIWRSVAIPDPNSPGNDKFPSQGFYSWWPVVYGNDVILMRTIFYQSTGAEGNWLFGTSPTTSMVAGTLSSETQPGYWPVGEKVLDMRTNPNGNSLPDYFEPQLSGDTRAQHGPYRRNSFFIDRATGIERQFDLDGDGKTDAAPVMMVGDGGTHDIPVVSGFNNVLYFNSPLRGRTSSFNSRALFGWKVGTPFAGMASSTVLSSDEPTGISGAGDKIYFNHCCDRMVAGINISRPNTEYPNPTSNREFAYVSQSGGGINYAGWPTGSGIGIPVAPTNNYYNEAIKFFWNPQPTYDPPCCAAVFWNENDKVGPSVYNGRLYVILGNALVAFSSSGVGSSAPVLPSAQSVAPTSFTTNVTDTQLRSRLEQEVTKIIDAGHLKPSFMWAGNMTLNNYSALIEDQYFHYWRNPAELQRVLLRALPQLYNSPTLQGRIRTYLQSEYTSYPLHLYSHVGFGTGTQRDPWPYPPLETSVTHLFNPPQSPQIGFDPGNIYAMWKYAQAGLGSASSLLQNIGTSFKSTIIANNSALDDTYLANFPLFSNKYINAYKGYIELKILAGTPLPPNDPYVVEYNRLLSVRVRDLMTFPNSENITTCNPTRCYYATMLTYYNFAYLTPELADYLRTYARSVSPGGTCDVNDRFMTGCKDIMAILDKYQKIAPYWMQVHNGETQGESAIQPYQQEHSMFQALAMIKRAPQSELIKYLDTPVVPIGDLYYIDNLVATLENSGLPTPTIGPTIAVSPTPTHCQPLGNADCDSDVDLVDLRLVIRDYQGSTFNYDFNNDGKINSFDITYITNYLAPAPTPSPSPTGGGGKGGTSTPTPTIPVTSTVTLAPTQPIGPTPTGSANIITGTGHTDVPSNWTFPAIGTANEAEFNLLMDQAIGQAKTEYGSGTPKVVMLITSFGHLDKFAIKAQTAFPGSLVVGTGTGNLSYNPFTESEFAEHNIRGESVLALGGNSITLVKESSQMDVGQGSNEDTLITAGSQLAKDLIPYFSSSLKNLVIYFGPGHDPNQRTMLCAFKLGFTTNTGQCNTGSTTLPPELPGYVKIVGTGGYYNANTVVGTIVKPTSAIAVLIQGNFQLALSGLAGTPSPSNISTPISQITSGLGGNPKMLFLVPAHPTVGQYDLLKQEMTRLLPNTTIFGHEGGGEIGHDSTGGPAIGDAFHLFMAGIK